MGLIRVQARVGCECRGPRAIGEVFEVSALEAVRLRAAGRVTWAPRVAAPKAAGLKRRYRRRDLTADGRV